MFVPVPMGGGGDFDGEAGLWAIAIVGGFGLIVAGFVYIPYFWIPFGLAVLMLIIRTARAAHKENKLKGYGYQERPSAYIGGSSEWAAERERERIRRNNLGAEGRWREDQERAKKEEEFRRELEKFRAKIEPYRPLQR